MIAQLVWWAASAAAAFDPASVEVDYDVVEPAEMVVPVGDSLAAATWDELNDKPGTPATVRMACVVLKYSGGPGSCLPADSIPKGQKRIDWADLRDKAAPALGQLSAADLALARIAERRMSDLRVRPQRTGNELAVVRFFDVVIGPSDEKPRLDTDNPLGLNEVSLANPPEASLLQMLYPPLAMRNDIGARVTVICRIEESLTLLCRDPGTVTALPDGAFDQADALTEQFRFATYQLASTIKLEPKTTSGSDVAGRNVRITISWAL